MGYLNELEKDNEILAELIDVKVHLNLEIEKEEAHWEKQALANWLKKGDNNTAFFHNFVS